MAHLSEALLLVLLTFAPLSSQMIVQPAGKSVPQAKTREELDTFGMVLDSGSPQTILTTAKRFRSLFPKSEFYEYACVAQMQAAMDLADMRSAEETASVVLSLNPSNPEALLTLGEVNVAGLASGAGVDAVLAQRAVEHAKAALDRVRALSLPPFSDSHTWLRTKRAMLARAHLVLVQVAIRQGQWQTAENEIQTAIDLVPSSKAYLLLSQVYGRTNRQEQALAATRKAESLAPVPLAEKADKKIRVLADRGGLQ
jgi:tetratricopeptide (TPR) repeat protein